MGIKIADLPTPCLVLDRLVLQRNLEMMARAVGRHGLALRPHMKTAKSIDVARMVRAASGSAGFGGITVSTLAEAEYFAAHGVTDILYAVGITPRKLDDVARLKACGAEVIVVTDDPDVASVIGAHPGKPRALIEIDSGEGRGGVSADDPMLAEIGRRLNGALLGVMTHAGHSYAGRTAGQMREIAETERRAVVRAAELLRAEGMTVSIVSMGSSPTAMHAVSLAGVTEVRAGVYMFGDLFQAGIGTHRLNDIACTVLASVIGRRPAEHRLLVDAGGLALSKDRSTQEGPKDYGFGLMLDLAGQRRYGDSVVRRAYQEHGVVECDSSAPTSVLAVGDKVRIAPNHVCMTVAAHDRYYVVEGGDDVVATWTRVNGW